ncbi:MAG: sugar nucleotide-binding protein [Planctomycetaceae bacterium]|jgi:dTDP-4-dehydrorhamnose reductase|nr:sugar nucleotide-binding protein [Planctomycetaceae bacterium]
MKIAIVGKNGLLGGALLRYAVLSGLSEGQEILPLDLPDFDVTSRMFTLDTFRDFQPNVIINTSGINLIDWLEKKPNTARTVHVQGTANLRETAKRYDALLVQISCAEVLGQTPQHIIKDESSKISCEDGRFLYSDAIHENQSGSKTNTVSANISSEVWLPLTEDCVPKPLSVYAKTKLDSERAAREAPRHLIVRTGTLFGKPGVNSSGNLVETLLNAFRRQEKMSVVCDLWTSYVWVEHLAEAVFTMIRQECTGLYHVANTAAASPFDVAQELVRLTGVRRDFQPISAADYNFTAPRAVWSVLDTLKYQTLPNMPQLPPWQQALDSYLASRNPFELKEKTA